jgi:hypothetical protein
VTLHKNPAKYNCYQAVSWLLPDPEVFAHIYTIEKNQELRFTRLNTAFARKAAHFRWHRPVDGL